MAATATRRVLSAEQQKELLAKVKGSMSAYEEIGTELQTAVANYFVTGADATCLLQLPT